MTIAEGRIADGAGLKRILFVDDDASVLAGLRNALRKRRHEWEMVFALGPEAALEKLAVSSFDVVVSDMRMPHMDGATLLTEVRRLQPKTVRMILTGQTEQESVLKSVFVAHMFLCKPCDPELLRRAIDRAFRLNTILNGEELKAAAGRVDMLPAAPRTYVALNEALTKPNCSASDVARIVERDVGLCAKILQLVNSAFFGLPRKISSLDEAVAYIGTLTIKNLALALEAFSAAAGTSGLSATKLAALQTHSLLAGQIAKRIDAAGKTNPDEAFLAGVLHEVGWLVRVDVRAGGDGQPSVERALLGAYLLGLWGLPHPILEAVAYHQDPQTLPHAGFELVDVIYVAHQLAGELDESAPPSQLEIDHLGRVGVTQEQLDRWRGMARQLAGKPE
jgi:HD-like signal output (HDOD) protein